jgi:hypothetical protein
MGTAPGLVNHALKRLIIAMDVNGRYRMAKAHWTTGDPAIKKTAITVVA